jgi:hypothetical protein
MGIPSTGDRVDAQNYYLRRMEKVYGDRIEFVYPEIYVGRIFHDNARNAYVQQFLASDCDLLWFLDSDIVPSERTLELVVTHYDKWDMAGAPYPVWMVQEGHDGPQVTYTVYKSGPNGGLCPTMIPESGIDFVEGIATGCVFIKRHVFEKMEKPYFEFKYDPITREIAEGEDLGFCIKANTLGYKFFIDYSMLCHHFKKISLLDVSNFLEYQKQLVIDNCDRVIRQVVAKKQLEKMNRREQVIEQPKSRLILP